MTLRILIDLDNAAFDDPKELPRIMHEIAESLAHGYTVGEIGKIADANGNTVGSYAVTRSRGAKR